MFLRIYFTHQQTLANLFLRLHSRHPFQKLPRSSKWDIEVLFRVSLGRQNALSRPRHRHRPPAAWTRWPSSCPPWWASPPRWRRTCGSWSRSRAPWSASAWPPGTCWAAPPGPSVGTRWWRTLNIHQSYISRPAAASSIIANWIKSVEKAKLFSIEPH